MKNKDVKGRQVVGHLDEGQLRAALDGELNSEQQAHLAHCDECQLLKQVIESSTQRTANKLAFLSTPGKGAAPSHKGMISTAAAWHRFHQQKLNQKEFFMFKKLFTSPALRFGLAAVLAVTAIITIPGARAFASQFLGLFRVQQVTVVPVDFTGMDQLNGVSGDNISRLISESVSMQQEPSDPVTVASAEEAGQLVDFTVRAPKGQTPSRISVMSGASFTFTIAQEKAQALLDEAGRSDLVLPKEADGAEVSVNIPANVSMAFGTCPEPSAEGEAAREMDRESSGSGSPGRMYADCVIFAQMPSPEVSAPPSLDIAKLAQIGLEFSGMSADEAAAFTSTVDWTSTLVVPIPRNAASYQQVNVDGVTGTLIERPSDDAPQFALLWVKDGIIYMIGGLGSNADQALEIANSLP